jgi:hypothetical protein
VVAMVLDCSSCGHGRGWWGCECCMGGWKG